MSKQTDKRTFCQCYSHVITSI